MTDTRSMSDVDTAGLGDHDHDSRTSTTDHAPAGDTLGPVDVTGWAYAVWGSIAGLVLALALLVAGGG